MRFLFTCTIIFYASVCFSQIPKPEEIYKKIEHFYTQNPSSIEIAERTFKSPLGYDMSKSRIAYIKLKGDAYILASLDSNFYLTNALCYDKSYYSVQTGVPQKVKIRNKDLGGTIADKLYRFPAANTANLESIFGEIKFVQKSKDEYRLTTTKYSLTVDTQTFRINSLFYIDFWKGKAQTDRYVFTVISDSLKNEIQQQAESLVNSVSELPATTYKQLDKTRVPVNTYEGKSFAFKNLIAFNKGELDSLIKNKYVILDFFYQSCLPCHKMTAFILDWLPTVDSSRIILVGIDPTDSETAMKLFVKDRHINYPIIIGKQAKEIVKHYNIPGYPTLFLLSPDGIIQTTHSGMSRAFLDTAKKIISE